MTASTRPDPAEMDRNTRAILDAVAAYATENQDKADAIVDLGCGEGWLLDRLAREGFHALTGIGFEVPELAGIRTVDGIDLCAPGWAGECGLETFRLAISTEVIEHLTNPLLFLQQAHRLLAPGGRLLLTFPNVHNLRSIVGYALAGRFSGFFGPNFNDNHPLFDQHIFIPNIHLIRYFLKIAGFTVIEEGFITGTGRLFSQTAYVVARKES